MRTFEIESLFGKGSQHQVGRLGDGSLIKWPYWKGKLWDQSTYETAKHDSELLKKMDVPIPEVEVIPSPTIINGHLIIKPPYAILTEEIRGRVFRELDLAEYNIADQIIELVRKSIFLRASVNCALDFLGGEAIGQFVDYLFHEKKSGQLGAYNVLINDQDERIKLIDTNLLDPKRAPPAVGAVINHSIDLQHILLSSLLQNQELIGACLQSNKSKIINIGAKRLYRISRLIETKRSGNV